MVCESKLPILFQHYTHFHEAKIKSSRTGRGQMLEAESEAADKSSRPRPRPRTKFWPRGQLGLEYLTSLELANLTVTIRRLNLHKCNFIRRTTAQENKNNRTVDKYTVWVKKSPKVFWHFFPNEWEYFGQILHACCTFLSTLDYKFLFNYLQLWRSYAIVSMAYGTQFTSHAQNVHHRPKRTLTFSDIFSKQLGIFSSNFTHLLHVPTYVTLQNSIIFNCD